MEPEEKVHPWSANRYFGVVFKGTQYAAVVRRNGKGVLVGSYASELEAAKCAWEKATEKQRTDARWEGAKSTLYWKKEFLITT